MNDKQKKLYVMAAQYAFSDMFGFYVPKARIRILEERNYLHTEEKEIDFLLGHITYTIKFDSKHKTSLIVRMNNVYITEFYEKLFEMSQDYKDLISGFPLRLKIPKNKLES